MVSSDRENKDGFSLRATNESTPLSVFVDCCLLLFARLLVCRLF